VTRGEAFRLLEIGAGTSDLDEIRRAYLRRVKVVRPETDPEGFARLRDAYELLGRRRGPAPIALVPRTARSGVDSSDAGQGTPATTSPGADPFGPYRERLRGSAAEERLAIAREASVALPHCAEARHALLAHLEQSSSEAFEVLQEGAARQPDEFLSPWLYLFPARVPVAALRAAAGEASLARRILIADAFAQQSLGSEAIDALRTAFEMIPESWAAPELVRLALRPIFSLHASHFVPEAEAAFTMLEERVVSAGLDVHEFDSQTVMLFSLAHELGRLGPSLPFGLRRITARAATTGSFDLLPTAAGMATESLSQREVEHWRRRIARHAPTLSALFRLDRAARKKEGKRKMRVAFLAPVALALARLVVGTGNGGTGPSIVSLPVAPLSMAAAEAHWRIQVACGNQPDLPECRELVDLENEMATSSPNCDRLRMDLTLIKGLSSPKMSDPLQTAIRTTGAAIELQCPQ
jgi:curved DNA-binding protein CbpA